MPAKTPQPIVDRLASAMQAVLKEPAVVKRWEEICAESSTMTPTEVTRFIQAEIDNSAAGIDAARADIRAVRAANPSLVPDPALFSPRFRSLYSATR